MYSLTALFPPSMIERFARIHEPNLPTRADQLYSPRDTGLVHFFFANGAIALVTALWASPAAWTLYNGLIAYVMMGLYSPASMSFVGISNGN